MPNTISTASTAGHLDGTAHANAGTVARPTVGFLRSGLPASARSEYNAAYLAAYARASAPTACSSPGCLVTIVGDDGLCTVCRLHRDCDKLDEVQSITRKAPNAAEFAARAVAANLGLLDVQIARAYVPTLARMEHLSDVDAAHKLIRLLRAARNSPGRREQAAIDIARLEQSMRDFPVR